MSKIAMVPQFKKPWTDTSSRNSSGTVECNVTTSLLSQPPPLDICPSSVSVTNVATIQIQPWEFIYTIPIDMAACKICLSHIISLIMWLSFAMDSLPMKKIGSWNSPRVSGSGTEHLKIHGPFLFQSWLNFL